MNLASLMVPSATAWIEYPGCPGFEVQLSHLTGDELRKIKDRCKVQKLNRKTRVMEDEVDSDAFQTEYISAVIKNWRGFKLKYLKKFIVANLNGADEEDELEYAKADAELLMKNSSDFDAWISDVIEDIGNFTESNSTS